jgi:hypothetical protein
MPTRLLALALAFAALPACAAAQSSRAGPYSVELVDDDGRALPTFSHRGQIWVLGTLGERYGVRVRNGSARRVEVVISVDGRDAVSGAPAGWSSRGYVVEPWGELDVDGFRTSLAEVAAFRFSSVASSYAARRGDARAVGVVGVAVFAERAPRPPPPPVEIPYGRAAPAPEAGGSADAPAASKAEPPAAAPSPGRARDALAEREDRRGLGTEFGEAVGSRAYRVEFERASARPDAVLAVRYDDRAGLVAQGIDVDGARAGGDDTWRRAHAEPFPRDPGFAAPPPGWRR